MCGDFLASLGMIQLVSLLLIPLGNFLELIANDILCVVLHTWLDALSYFWRMVTNVAVMLSSFLGHSLYGFNS